MNKADDFKSMIVSVEIQMDDGDAHQLVGVFDFQNGAAPDSGKTLSDSLERAKRWWRENCQRFDLVDRVIAHFAPVMKDGYVAAHELRIEKTIFEHGKELN